MKKVLVLDDDRNFAKVMGKMVENLDGEAQVYTSPVLALEAVKKNPPDLMLIDMLMPNINGIQFIREVRKLGVLANAILVTGAQHAAMSRLLPTNRVKTVVGKPVSLEELAKLVREELCSEGGVV